jgi:cytochrome P450
MYEVVGLLQVILANIISDLTNNLATQLRRPDVLGRLRSEIDARIPCSAVIPSLDQIQLPYLNMVLKETLRYRSTGFGTCRTCLVDTEVSRVLLPVTTTLALWNPVGQWHIHLQHFSTKNMNPMRILIYESTVHRDPKLWEDPDDFNPDRWRPRHSKIRGSYFPFSNGPGNCLGSLPRSIRPQV